MQHLHELLTSTEAPFLYVLILGLLTAVSPCQFARNITAIGYISRNIRNTKRVFLNGLYYTLGNAAGYFIIAFILFLGASKFHVSRILVSNGNILIGLILVITGLFMLDIIRINIPGNSRLQKKIEERQMGAKSWIPPFSVSFLPCLSVPTTPPFSSEC